MSLVNQMKLAGLIDLSLILILVSNSKGETWGINVTRQMDVLLGSDVIIPCTFTYPPKQHTKNVQVYWKKHEKSKFTINDNDRNAFVFHTNDTFVLEKYKKKTKLLGNKTAGECTLQIKNITEHERNIYVRVIAKSDNYSFKAESVSIYLSGSGVTQVIFNSDSTDDPLPTSQATPTDVAPETSKLMYMAIFVAVAALLIILFVTGIVFVIKRKRSQSSTREGSGYYANFSRTSSNQAKREASCKKQDNKTLPQPKTIDEPVYINLQAPPGQMDQSMDQSMDHTDSIYANVDYSK